MVPYNPLQYLAMSTCMHTLAILMPAQGGLYSWSTIGGTSPRIYIEHFAAFVGVRNKLKRTNIAHHHSRQRSMGKALKAKLSAPLLVGLVLVIIVLHEGVARESLDMQLLQVCSEC